MCLVVGTLVGWGGLGWAAHLCSMWCLLSGGRQTGYQSTSWPSLCSDPIGQSRSHDQGQSRGLEKDSPDGRSCSHFAKGCAPHGRRALKEEVGCWSLSCRDRPSQEQRARRPLRWFGASQGVDMPLAISWALARLPQTL